MGYIRHHAIVVTGHDEWAHDSTLPTIHEARDAAVDAGCVAVTDVAVSPVNGYASFLVAPDGSKESWKESDEGDTARGQFIEWLRRRGDGGYYDWVEVVLGADDAEALIERSSYEERHTDCRDLPV